MTPKLIRSPADLHHIDVNGHRVSGPSTGLRGNCSGLYGNCSGLYGDCTDLRGDLDDCEITLEDRAAGVDVQTLAR